MSAVSSIAGGLVSGVSSLVGGSMQNSAAANMQKDTEDYDTYMADTQYQRGVADMRAAGLNPILAAGSPDASPTVSQAPVANVVGSAMNDAISNYSALQTSRQTDAQVDNTKAQTNLNQALTAKAAADTTSALASARNSNASASKTESGSLMSDVFGSNAASKASDMLNSAIDTAGAKIKDVISNINTSSGRSLYDNAKDWFSGKGPLNPFDSYYSSPSQPDLTVGQ